MTASMIFPFHSKPEMLQDFSYFVKPQIVAQMEYSPKQFIPL